jgi:hypothetical protein
MTIKYPFNKDGVKRFMLSAYDDIFTALETQTVSADHDIFITIGDKEIQVPSTAWAYQCMEEYLQEVATDYYGEDE